MAISTLFVGANLRVFPVFNQKIKLVINAGCI